MHLFVDPEPEVLLLFIYVVLRIFITHSFIHAYFNGESYQFVVFLVILTINGDFYLIFEVGHFSDSVDNQKEHSHPIISKFIQIKSHINV